MLDSWIYLADTGNSTLIKARLNIFPYSVFHKSLLICDLTRTISLSNIVLEHIGSFYIFSLILLFPFDETSSTIQALKFLRITLISSVFL